MAYILVEYEGSKTFGGYLWIDGGGQIDLEDGGMIMIPSGTHSFTYSTQNAENRKIANMNESVGNHRLAVSLEKDTVEGTFSERFDNNTLMVFTIVSDSRGRVTDLPVYRMKEMTPEELKEANELYAEYLTVVRQRAQKKDITELILCILLGWLGVHKFYRGKTRMGILYLFTLGIAGIGVLIDALILIIRIIARKKGS